MISGASGGRDNEDSWDKENRNLRQNIQTITDQIEKTEKKITFYVDASGHLIVCGEDYDVRHLRDVATIRNYVLARMPENMDNQISFYNDLNAELERWTGCMREVGRLRARKLCLSDRLNQLKQSQRR
jgi:hypothetical protein